VVQHIQDDVLDRIAIKTQASHERVAEARADSGFGFVKIAAGIIFFKGSGPTATPLISTFAPGGVLVMRSFSACVAHVKTAHKMSAVSARSRRERDIGEYLHRMKMN
jgi:hypothetical protein